MKIQIILMVLIFSKINSINWCDNENYNYCTPMQNQFLPFGCEKGEFIMAAISTISDKLNIRNQGKFPEIMLSPQLLICNLHFKDNGSCSNGFEMTKILEEIKTEGLVDDTCLVYKGDETHCPSADMNVCDNSTNLKYISEDYNKKTYKNFKIKNYTKVDAPKIDDDLKNGPILCSIQVPNDFHAYTKEQANFKKFENNLNTIYVSIVGLEKNNGNRSYYIIRNSHGEQFGDNGFFKNYINENDIKDCYNIELEGENDHKIYEYNHNNKRKEIKKIIKDDGIEYVDEVNYFDYCIEKDNQNVCTKKINISTPIKSQAKTGNCWAFACITALQDRMMIKNYRIRLGIDGYTKNETQSIEKIVLSEQSIVNYFNGGSGTGGGDGKIVYTRLSLDKWDGPNKNELIVTRKTCTNFREADPKIFRENFSQICSTKDGKEYNFLKDNNLNNLGYRIKGVNLLKGQKDMKKALKDGPISCGMNAKALKVYLSSIKGDFNPKMILQKKIKRLHLDHEVTVVGYGEVKGGPQDKEKYWIVRNSWSVGWNDNGIFKLRMGKDNFGIEANCSAAIL